MTPHQRFVLRRIKALGQATIDQARDGHPNNMPKLITKGWVSYTGNGLYMITDAGLAALEEGEQK